MSKPLQEWKAIKKPEELLRAAQREFGSGLKLACSFSPEDIVIIEMLCEKGPADATVFAIDTGRLPEETYEVAEEVRRRYGIAIEWFYPDRDKVETLERTKGLFSFRESLDNRHECCGIRKVEPLRRALEGASAWITGRRQEQSVTRFGLDPVEEDNDRAGVLKFNPLASWTSREVWEVVRGRNLPYNKLHDRGYPSIGCAPCTRAVAVWDDERAGRWWWENPESKECGLHVASGGRERGRMI
ncbi:MAG: phosphoadenylyl-sulfate reductase [Deltaproteobacteria bacterium]|nr:phosphoadenylyl-sulfate reductase [Deltaproteobacteria bacterium]